MVGEGEYALGVLQLVSVVASLGFAAHRLRARLIPSWWGAPALLVEVIVTVALLVWTSEVLGIAGLLAGFPLVAASLLIGATAWKALPPPAAGVAPEHAASPPDLPPWAKAGTGAIVCLAFARWGIEVKQSLEVGVSELDSLWYHLPFAAEMAQSGSVTGVHYTDTAFTNWFYPQNSELLHAGGMILTGRDTFSLFLNLLWLAVALLSAWCIGRPFGRGHLTVAAVAIILNSSLLVAGVPGQAKTDVAAAALLLAAIAILVSARGSQQRGAVDRGVPTVIGWPLAAAGLAAGLAAGTKVTVLAGVAALSLSVVVLAPGGRRKAACAWWLGPLVAGCVLWYARNVVVTGNPIPQVTTLGPIGLPGPEPLQTARPDHSVAHYLTDLDVWQGFFAPGLHDSFGSLWPAVMAAALGGIVLAILRPRTRAARWLGIVALTALLAYLVTPSGASGAEGAPEGFGPNLRYAIPGLLIGMTLLAIAPVFDRPDRRRVLFGVLAGILVLTDRADWVLRSPRLSFGILVVTAAVVVPWVLLTARVRGRGPGLLYGGAAALALAIAVIGYPIQRSYLDRHLTRGPFLPGIAPVHRWAEDLSGARIGLAGTAAAYLQYGFYGEELTNEVTYIGREAPSGGFDAIPSCSEFRRAVNRAVLEYLVTSPFLDFAAGEVDSPERRWLRGETGVTAILQSGRHIVWRVDGQLHPAFCGPQNRPLREVPDHRSPL